MIQTAPVQLGRKPTNLFGQAQKLQPIIISHFTHMMARSERQRPAERERHVRRSGINQQLRL